MKTFSESNNDALSNLNNDIKARNNVPMSKELDTKLKSLKLPVTGETVDRQIKEPFARLNDNDIEQIKQAFTDAGYIQVDRIRNEGYKAVDKYLDNRGTLPLIVTAQEQYERTLADNGYMTGQEWYEKLLLEVDTNRYYKSDPEYIAQNEVFKAAKRAAGLPIEETK